jgi:hypothetical protein
MRRALVLVLLASLSWLAVPRSATAQLTSIPPAAPTTSIAPTTPMPLSRPPDVIDQARQRALSPVPQAPGIATPGERWVPERRFFSPVYGRELVVPGHYETRINDQQYAVPPVTSYGPQGQTPVFIPGGERPPADVRQGP